MRVILTFFYNNASTCNVNSNIYPIIKNIFFNDRIEHNAILFLDGMISDMTVNVEILE